MRVLVVDDQKLFREGVVELLTRNGAVSVVGQAEDGEEALRLTAALLPDVVVMDIHMPRLDGIHATSRIAATHPSVRVLVMSSEQTDERVVEALQAGAIGYLSKDSNSAGLLDAVMRAARGNVVLDNPGQRAMVTAAVGRSRPRKAPAGLSNRQFEILRLMTCGLGLKQIGRELGLAEKTVRNQASLMYAKLQVHDRVQAVLYATWKGLVA